MRFRGLIQPLRESKEFINVMYNINKSKFPIEVSGLSESGRSYFIYTIYEEINRPLVVVADNDVEAKKIYEDLSLYLSNVYYFPTKEIVFYNLDAVSGDLRWERIKVIREILTKGRKIVVTSIEAFSPYYVPVELYRKYSYNLGLGDAIDLEKFSKELILSGYERVETVDSKGQFSIRGGIFDIFPPISNMPYRIEFFGDEIDSIRTFNTGSQRSIEKVNKIDIFPAKEIVLEEGNIKTGYNFIKQELDNVLEKIKEKGNEESQKKIGSIIKRNLETLKESSTFETIDSFLPFFYEKPSTFFDYIEDAIVIVEDDLRCKGKLNSVYFEFQENYKSFLEKGDILPSQGKLLFPQEEVYEMLNNNKVINMTAIEKSKGFLRSTYCENFREITLSNFGGVLELLINEIKDKKDKGYKTVILCGSKPRGERLVNTLRDRGIESSYRNEIQNIQFGEIIITFGSLNKSFEYPDLKLCVISDKEIFGESKRRSKKKPQKGVSKIKSFAELKPGDYIVHVNHGIGVYKGIEQLEVEGHKKDYLELTYSGDDKLFVPVEQLDLVQKYIGSDGNSPKINKLGGNEWSKAKNKVRKSINEIAEELVKLYAIRSTLKGYTYSNDTVWQKQFEDEFPYDETPDQLSAIEDIKQDMEVGKVMDRLLCGDVGYGKTEVAVRIAFKAVMDGKQVAFLVPTTILAEQHYTNFKKRFSDFPVKIDMISRFRTSAQQKSTIKALKEGNVDILIGTHRILQKDVQFKDLGLLIVDEEQRFGVTHKEKIKNLKKNIDVLTLTATPIPRTLHMSLTGVRDISVMETPPEERYPVQTYVVEYNDQLIRDAIMRELNRGGQVFFVYNRVETINDMAGTLAKLLPEAKIAVAHGQMTERELETEMLGFMNKEYDILLCTTIIETGIDIQNVNTMIIYDADRMGLSQLYQLRGRVGRTNRMAYAYFTYRKDKVLTEVAEKRLKAIKEFTELGSGFKIAMRDLEIRGAGNMMGSAQHGHMASIGYDLYCRMLEDAIKQYKGDIEKEPIETFIDIKVDAYIPNSYIKNEIQKIEIYKKIASIESKDEFLDIQEELEDRYSDIPPSVSNLMHIAYIKSLARQLGVIDIKDKKDFINVKFNDKDRITDCLVKNLIKDYNKSIIFKVDDKPMIIYNLKNLKREELLNNLTKLFQYMIDVINN
ncbi:transcription-repair-coupling factor [Clostridium pasteurianum DSM 525 = ATCC 6013]|uniref:Transcription-repair-coupling factor n=1 Tax=Clostridium pasteurianum DSM 525 = ATCC 6013 TaxID=1262449 RepID=A0A0H3JBI4_CLOPA|nr:transcription-repair coupling factor [Clostridium pasteurianum]AJA49785.1 transcription-repair-coupling factor [Clostridium pasteurianum DSM 525 = ATCC 6013]AJA53773.1 transcription-repair-coupling factor [Clostridium pasteurianum DSM 525 = ATCC 6013]AOZ76936.1 transcription-repair coupling factor [Clostridium pasteurianum DSM 525 = ATCC 6013]AOZ80733.1 transcription-repair coupling factor [Clostridium pasteurianum]ELP57708.1 transcription-repair coupling factor [Clostridium pasteurianum DS